MTAEEDIARGVQAKQEAKLTGPTPKEARIDEEKIPEEAKSADETVEILEDDNDRRED